MKSNHPKENNIREYLLGRLNDQPEVEESMSEKMFFDDELSELVDVIEDEILDEYLDGSMNPDDKDAVEKYFLLPPERKEKLQFVSLLRQQLEAEGTLQAERYLAPAGEGSGAGFMVSSRSRVRTFVELATVVVLSISCWVYVSHVRQGFQSRIAEDQKRINQLEEERRRSASVVEAKLESAHLTTEVAEFRAVGEPISQVTITPSTRRVAVELDLKSGSPSGPYRVVLKQRGIELWSMAEIRSTADVLFFEVPSQVFKTGGYSFEVSLQAGPKQGAADFEAITAK
jgi:hypothetical protein